MSVGSWRNRLGNVSYREAASSLENVSARLSRDLLWVMVTLLLTGQMITLNHVFVEQGMTAAEAEPLPTFYQWMGIVWILLFGLHMGARLGRVTAGLFGGER